MKEYARGRVGSADVDLTRLLASWLGPAGERPEVLHCAALGDGQAELLDAQGGNLLALLDAEGGGLLVADRPFALPLLRALWEAEQRSGRAYDLTLDPGAALAAVVLALADEAIVNVRVAGAWAALVDETKP